MIFEAVALISTANAAISTVKEALANGRDIMDCGRELSSYFDCKAEIQKNASRSGSGADLENFMALEKLKVAEEELKTMLIYQGRAGLYQDFLRYQADQKRGREEAQLEGVRKKVAREKAFKDGLLYCIAGVSIVGLLGGAVAFIYWLVTNRGALSD
tara:strand:- start:13980 stop:14450 length:471 start_codon:yes stop_codon:yes gene_type:complete